MTAATGSAPAWAERTFQPAGHDTVEHTWTAPTRFAAAVGFSHEPIEHSIGLSREDTLTVDETTGAPRVVEGEPQVYLFGIEWLPVDQVPALIAALREVLEAAGGASAVDAAR